MPERPPHLQRLPASDQRVSHLSGLSRQQQASLKYTGSQHTIRSLNVHVYTYRYTCVQEKFSKPSLISSRFNRSRLVFAERLLEERIALPCRYSDSGCAEELLSRDLDRHERDCPHRPTKCPHRGCPVSTSHARKGSLFHFAFGRTDIGTQESGQER